VRALTLRRPEFSALLRLGVFRQPAIFDKITIPIGPGVTFADYTIPACDLDNTLLFFMGMEINVGNPDAWSAVPKLRMLNTTTIRAEKLGETDAADCYFAFGELVPGVLSYVERGVGTTTLARPVNAKRAFVNLLGHTQTSTASWAPHRAVLSADGTTVTVTGSAFVGWQAFEL
jgi:hypothetical protein